MPDPRRMGRDFLPSPPFEVKDMDAWSALRFGPSSGSLWTEMTRRWTTTTGRRERGFELPAGCIGVRALGWGLLASVGELLDGPSDLSECE